MEVKSRHDSMSEDQFSRPQGRRPEIIGRESSSDKPDILKEAKMVNPADGGFKMTPEILAALFGGLTGESIVEKITKAPTEEERKYWTYFIMDRIVNYNDEWPAKALRESLALRAANGSDALSELRGDDPKTPEEKKKQDGIEQSLTLVQDIDKLFDQWFGFYKNIAPSGKIHQAAFNALSEFMAPEYFARVYGEMPGFKEGDKEWKSVSEQVDIGIRAFMYLALQSDPRWKDDLKWFRQGSGFKKLFPNDSSEKEWLHRLKLKTLPNENNKVAYLYKRSYDSLTDADKALLDTIPAFNRFADANNGGTVKAIMETVEETVRQGAYQDNKGMKMQSQIAVNFAEKTFRFFGLAAMYGTRATKMEGDKAVKVNDEQYPWNDAMAGLTQPRDHITYCLQNSYYAGPAAWVNFAPEHIMVDFLRMMPVRDKEFPDSKGNTRSAMELFVEGKTIGEIFKDEDHIGDWSYRAYLIRLLFSLREDNGAQLAMSGEITRGKGRENTANSVFWEGVEKSIFVVCRDWIITNGKYKEWFTEHSSEVDELILKMSAGGSTLPPEELKIEAEDALLKKYVKQTNNEWKAIAWLSAMENRSDESIASAIIAAKEVKYLDDSVLDKTPKGRKNYQRETLGEFIQLARSSAN